MFAAVQPPVKLSLLSLTPKAHAAELLSSLCEGGKNKSMQLILRRVKEARTCNSFWEEGRGQEHAACFGKSRLDADQPNTKRNHANDPLEVPIGPITRARAKKLKEALNGLVQNIWSKMDLEELGTFKEHEGQPLIHLVQVQEEPNSCGTRG